jgi:fibronectin type 3 domain-containing protein
LPLTLSASQTATLTVQFDPTAAGTATGTLTITSTSSTDPTEEITLTGTGVASTYEVNLSWSAPEESSVAVTGYNVYRSASSSSSYEKMNSSTLSETSYVDSTVEAGETYDYVVESVDADGKSSAPSNAISVTVP